MDIYFGGMEGPWNCWIQLWEILIRERKSWDASKLACYVRVQKDPADRPTMASILHTLNSYSVTLESLEQPAFFLLTKVDPSMPAKDMASGQSISMSMPWSVDEAYVPEPHPR
jgi:hypothetical protein